MTAVSIVPATAHVFWLFGLSGAGKTTLAHWLAAELRARGIAVLWLDGDELRGRLCRGLGFSDSDRAENPRVDALLATCKNRDVKGLYAGAEAGKVTLMTGMTSGFEKTARPGLTIETGSQPANASAALLCAYAAQRLQLTQAS